MKAIVLWLGDDDDGGKDDCASWTLCPISALDWELPGQTWYHP